MAHFDWYQATIQEYPRVVADALMTISHAAAMTHGRGRHNYHESASILDSSGETIATMLHGGPNGSPNVTGSGDNAEAVAATIRKYWPEHRVTRIDACEDIRGDFSSYHEKCRAIARDHRIKAHTHAPDDLGDGSTYYIGSKSSATTFRCYEKGKQLRSLAADPESVPLDWLRLETQHRPVRDAKETAASLTADQVWGVSAWTHRIARDLLGNGCSRLTVRPRLLTTFERRSIAADRQYGALFAEIAAKYGGWEAVGPYFRDLGHTIADAAE